MRNRILLSAALFCMAAGYSYGSCTASSPYACTGGSLSIAATNQNGNLASNAQTVSGLTGSISKVTVTLTNWTDNGGNPQDSPGDTDREMMLVFQPTSGSAQTFQFLGGFGSFDSLSSYAVTFDDSATKYAPDVFEGLNSGDEPPVNPGLYKPTVNEGSTYCSVEGGFAAFGSPAPSSALCATDNQSDTTPGNNNSDGHSTFSSQFSGNPNGTWTLYVWTNGNAEDSAASIAGWTVTITTQANAANTTTTLTSNATNNETTENTSVTLTATVNSTSTVSEGTVTFTDNGSNLTCSGGNPAAVSSGTATCVTSFSTEGNHPLEAAYSGGTDFGTSHGTLNFFVDHATTNPSPGQYCNTGTITINTATQPGTTPYPSHITIPSQSGATLSNVTLQLPSITTDSNGAISDYNYLLVDPNGNKFIPLAASGGAGAASGVSLTLSDFGSGTVPNPSGAASSGTYLPTDNNTGLSFPSGTPSGPYSLPQSQGGATFETTFAGSNPVGQWSLYAYDTSGQQTGSIGGYCLTITTSNAAATTTTVTSSPNMESTAGQNVTFTATVKSGGNPVSSGTVTFTENGTTLSGPTTVNGSGQATFQTSSLSEGIHTITANYSGVAGTFNVSSGMVTIEIDTATTNPSTGVYCNAGGINISASNSGTNIPAGPYPSRINVTSLAGTVSTVSVSLNNFTSGQEDSPAMLLAGPTSTNIVFWNGIGGDSSFSSLNLKIADSAGSGNPIPAAPSNNGTYYPTSNQDGLPNPSFPSPAPSSGSLSFAPSMGSQTFTSAFQNINGNGFWSLYVYDRFGSDQLSINNWCVNFTENPPVLAVTETGPTAAEQGQTGLQYTIGVTNNGPGSTGGTLTLTPNSSSGMTLTGLSTTDSSWTCGATTCTRTTAMANGASSTFTATYSAAGNATSPQTVSASVSGGGAATANSTTVNITISSPAAVTNVTSTTANGSYTVGAVISITVTFSKAVTVTGTPQLALNSGGTATYASGSGTATLTFSYTVGAGQNSSHLDYSSTSALSLNGGTIDDSAPAPANLTLPMPGAAGSLSANTNIVIDTVAILSISAAHSSPIFQGGPGMITLTVGNAGVATTATATVSDAINSAFTINSASSSSTSGSCLIGGQNVTCTIASGTSFTSIAFTVNVTASTMAGTPISNSATLTDSGDTVTTGSANDSIPVTMQAPQVDSKLSQLVLSGSTDNGTCAAGNRTLTATDMLQNTSGSTLTNPYAAGITFTQGDTLLSQSASSASVAPGADVTFTFHIQLVNCNTFRLSFDVDSN